MSEDKGHQAASFEDRLDQARRKQGLDAPTSDPAQAGKGSADGNAMAVGLRVGVELVSTLAVAVAIGWWLDHYFHTMPLFLILFVLLGGAAGIANVWRLLEPKT
jgi:ATP synthase protein I